MKTKLKSSKRRSFNLIDVLIILLILAIIGVAAYSYVPGISGFFKNENTDIEYCFVISGMSADAVSGITTGASVICDKVEFGIVKSVTQTNTKYYAYSENSKSIVMNSSNESFDAVIVVSADAEKLSDGYTVSGKKISAGLEYDIILPDYAGRALCLYVTEGQNE